MKIPVKRRLKKLTERDAHHTKTGSLEAAAHGFTVIVDTREQLPWDLRPFRQRPGTLNTGDYEIEGHQGLLCIERKGVGLNDLVGCIGRSRDRFERELERLAAFTHRFVIVEGSWLNLCAGRYRGSIPAAAAMGTVAAWQVRYNVPFLFCGNRLGAEAMAIRLLAAATRGLTCAAPSLTSI